MRRIDIARHYPLDEINEHCPKNTSSTWRSLGQRNDFVACAIRPRRRAERGPLLRTATTRRDPRCGKLDILARAASLTGMFILPAMTAGAVAAERYNLWKAYRAP